MLKTIYEDDLILAIDKPSGLPSNSLTHSTKSVELVLQEMRPNETLLLVHRLDTGTSGVLLFAKTESAFTEMRELFKLKKVEKTYLAWVARTEMTKASLDQLIFPLAIESALAHHAKSKKRMIALLPNDRHFRGKPIPAHTIIHQATQDIYFGQPALRFEVEILTGVMHQIRVHLASVGLPLFGDSTYNKNKNEHEVRLGLHAHQIKFSLNGFRYELFSAFD